MTPGFPRGATALAILALLAAATPARAAGGEGMELVLSLGAGVYVPTQDNGGFAYDPVYGVGFAVHAPQPGVDLELAVSGWWGSLGAQIGAGYLSASWGQASIGIVPVRGLFRARLPLGAVAPYLEVGAGLCFIHSASYDATAPEWTAGAGADLEAGPFLLGISLRYQWVGQQSISGTQDGLRYRSGWHLDGLTAAATLGYRFTL